MKTIELLDKIHNRTNFDCGNEYLNRYLQQTARQHNQKGISRTFVLTDTTNKKNKIIIGFFSLSLCEVRSEKLPPSLAKKYPLNVSGVKLARLAVDINWQGKGIGEILIIEAMNRAVIISDNAGVVGLFVDAKDEKAKNYYTRYGFISLEDNLLEMFLPLATIRQII